MDKYPLVSVIVANWNGGKIYENFLNSIQKISYPNWELIVVDNGSTDGTADLSKDPKFKFKKSILIKNKKNLGFAPANNQGYAVSSGKYILLINNDTLVQKNFLNVLVDKLEAETDIGVIQPKIKIMDNPSLLDNAGSFITIIGFLSHWGFMKKDTREYDKEREVFSTKGACMLIRREVIKSVGLFDSDFMSYFEESDFCWKSWLIGYRSLFYPKTYILHKVGFTIKRLDVTNLNWHYYKNRISALIKNLSLPYLAIMLTSHLLISFAISFVFLLKGQFKNSWLIIKAIFWNVLNIRKTIRKRSKIQRLRVFSDQDLFKKLMVKVDWRAFFNDFKRVEKDLKKKKI